ncbi:titan9 [Rhynchospora pubera]|uniref:Titan9 n=1 Tax=Rhynchospora pubera TaxID=906938 RepID=A0AAV8E779_9POAL|nr:titan9 [Rhynchospora pubera]
MANVPRASKDIKDMIATLLKRQDAQDKCQDAQGQNIAAIQAQIAKLDSRIIIPEDQRITSVKGLSSEASSLQNLLSQKNEATISIEMSKLQKNEATISIETTKEPPKADIIEEDNASQNEIANQSVCRCISNGHGGLVVRDCISDILRTLIENVLGMRVTFGPQCAEVIHEKSGYAFSLTWSTDGDELVYRVSSLGTLANIALKWMKEEIMFNTKMCPLFFNRIRGIIGCA